MSQDGLTFEEVDRAMQAVDLTQFQQGGRSYVVPGAAPADILKQVCAIYRVVRPVLALIAGVPVLPKKWRDAVKTFMGILDGICPSS